MEPRYLLDTNTIIYMRRENPIHVREVFDRLREGETAMSVITFGELIYGVSKSTQREAATLKMQKIAQIIPVLALPEEAANIYGTIRAELESKGQMIGYHDLWIAAHAIAARLTLVTNNEKEFRRVSELTIENWAKP